MSDVMKVLPFPNPFLRERANPVEVFDDELAQLVEMKVTMKSEDGLGLAATQVGVNARVLILSQQAFLGEEGQGEPI